LLQERRSHPRDDVLTALGDLEARGYRDDEEAITMAIFLLLAGHETTSTMLTLMTLNLLRNRAELERVRADPSLAQNTVEECLRYDSPTQIPAHRIWAREDIELSGVTVPAGALVIPVLGAANRDAGTFADPDRLDVSRDNARRHLAFLFGTHVCAGAPLARVELQVALRDLVTKLPPFELATDDVDFRPNAIVRGVNALPIGW
jgi:cytochrome P450